jgi:hypothetical protein
MEHNVTASTPPPSEIVLPGLLTPPYATTSSGLSTALRYTLAPAPAASKASLHVSQQDVSKIALDASMASPIFKRLRERNPTPVVRLYMIPLLLP